MELHPLAGNGGMSKTPEKGITSVGDPSGEMEEETCEHPKR